MFADTADHSWPYRRSKLGHRWLGFMSELSWPDTNNSGPHRNIAFTGGISSHISLSHHEKYLRIGRLAEVSGGTTGRKWTEVSPRMLVIRPPVA